MRRRNPLRYLQVLGVITFACLATAVGLNLWAAYRRSLVTEERLLIDLESADRRVVARAATRLVEMASTAAIDPMLDAFARDERFRSHRVWHADPDLSRWGARANGYGLWVTEIARRCPLAAAPYLVKRCSDPSIAVRAACLVALDEIDDLEIAQHLRVLLAWPSWGADDDRENRLLSLAVRGVVAQPDAFERLLERWDDFEPRVRSRATSVLERLDEQPAVFDRFVRNSAGGGAPSRVGDPPRSGCELLEARRRDRGRDECALGR